MEVGRSSGSVSESTVFVSGEGFDGIIDHFDAANQATIGFDEVEILSVGSKGHGFGAVELGLFGGTIGIAGCSCPGKGFHSLACEVDASDAVFGFGNE